MILVLSAVLSAALASGSPKISDATVLLPTDPGAVFTLEGENGCFSFSTDREDILVLVPLGEECVREVRISVNPSYKESSSSVRAIVTAREKKGAELRSEVYISAIARLELVTRIRRLAVGEIEAIQMQAFDRVGNTFSTLEGLEFKWDVSKAEPALKNVLLKNTEFSLSQSRLALERAGKQADLFIVRGQEPGKALLSASFGQQIKAHPVSFSVVETFRVAPSLLGLAFCGSAQISVTTGNNTPVSLPNAAYSLGIPLAGLENFLIKPNGQIFSITKDKSAQISASVTDLRTDDNEELVRLCAGEITAVKIVAETLFPVVGSEIGIRLAASSKDCPHVPELHLGGAHSVFDVSGDVDFFDLKKTVESENKILVKEKVGAKIFIAASLLNVTGECVYSANKTTKHKVEIKAVEQIAAHFWEGEDIVLPSLPMQQQEAVEAFVSLKGGSGRFAVSAGRDVSVNEKGVLRIGGTAEGVVKVEDAHNEKNFAVFSIFRRQETKTTEFSLRSNPDGINAFIGYDVPVEDYIVTSEKTFFNCSSLVDSVRILDDSIAHLSYSPEGPPGTCGKLVVQAKRPGKSEIVIASCKLGATKCVEKNVALTVFSAFKIKPVAPLYEQSAALIAVNSSLVFKVEGGSLRHIARQQQELVMLSQPWVAEVVTNASLNELRIICKSAGKSRADIVHTSGDGGVEFECVKQIDQIAVLADARARINSSIFITCGHEEIFNLWLVGVDSKGRKFDNASFANVQWNEGSLGKGERVSVQPLACGSEVRFTVSASNKFFLPQIFNTTVLVKARDTVRAGIGVQLSKLDVYLPCGGDSWFSIAFLGGSGEYIFSGDAEIDGKIDDSRNTFLGETANNLLAFASLPASLCGRKHVSVTDAKINDSKLDLFFVLEKIDSVSVSILGVDPLTEPVPFVVKNEWTDLQISVKFSDGKRVDSVADAKWFAVTRDVFGWKIQGGELRISNSGRIEILPKNRLILISSTRISGELKLEVTLIDTLLFSPSRPWNLAVSGSSELAVRGNLSDQVNYVFSSSPLLSLAPTSRASVMVSAIITNRTGESHVSLTATTKAGRSIFTWTQKIHLTQPVSIRIPSFSVQLHSSASLTAEPVDQAGESLFPPTQLGASCNVKWSLYGSLPGQSTRYAFKQIGNVPVKVYVSCPNGLARTQESSAVVSVLADEMGVIKPVAILAVNGEYPDFDFLALKRSNTSEFEKIQLSESQVGFVAYRAIARAEMEKITEKVVVQVGQQVVIAKLSVKDKFGNTIAFPSNMRDQITVGSDRPLFVDVHMQADAVVATGLRSGCSSVFLIFYGKLAGIQNVCVEYPILPAAAETGLVVSPNAEIHFQSSADLSRILIRNISFESLSPPARQFVDSVKLYGFGFEVVLKNGSCAEPFLRLLDGGEPSFESNRTVSARELKQKFIQFHNQVVYVSVEPVAHLVRMHPLRSLVHKQNLEQTIWFEPVTASGDKYSASRFIDQKFHHICQLDEVSRNFFQVSPVLSTNLGCKFNAILPSESHMMSKRIMLTVMMGALAQTVEISLESHFHVAVGKYSVSAPSVIQTVSEAVSLQLVNVDPKTTFMLSEACLVQIVGVHEYIAVSPFNATGHFKVTRTSPRGSSRVHLTTFCGIESVDTVIEFLDVTSRIFNHLATPTVYDNALSVVFSYLWWFIKIISSIAAVVGVGLLFKFQIGNLPHAAKSIRSSIGRRLSLAPKFSPHPHQEEDTFITDDQPRRRTTGVVSRWSSFAE